MGAYKLTLNLIASSLGGRCLRRNVSSELSSLRPKKCTRGCLIERQPQGVGSPLDFWGVSNGQVDRRSSGGLDSEVLAVRMCNSILKMVVVWMRIHFVEVKVEEMVVWMAGIRNAVAVLDGLQRICKRLLVLAVQMLILVWGFASSLLEMGLFLMAIQGTPYKGVSWFRLVLEKHVCMCCSTF